MKVIIDNHQIEFQFIDKIRYIESLLYFYRTQVNLGSDLWVRMSVSEYKTFV